MKKIRTSYTQNEYLYNNYGTYNQQLSGWNVSFCGFYAINKCWKIFSGWFTLIGEIFLLRRERENHFVDFSFLRFVLLNGSLVSRRPFNSSVEVNECEAKNIVMV